MKIGILFNPLAFWVGGHINPHSKRLCINILPCVTIWFVLKGGTVPRARPWYVVNRIAEIQEAIGTEAFPGHAEFERGYNAAAYNEINWLRDHYSTNGRERNEFFIRWY